MTKSIMIVDDNSDILHLFGGLFERRGYGVLRMSDSASALEMLDDTIPNLFILDVMMPEMNGIELCQRIRALPQHKQTPIIILSAYSATETVEQTFAAGANDYVLKPIDPEDLEAKVHQLLDAAGSDKVYE